MRPRREMFVFGAFLAVVVSVFFYETLFGGQVLSPADVLLVSASFRGEGEGDYEPANRLLMDPVLQFQPWLELNRTMVRAGRLPVWNMSAGCGAPHLANGQSGVFDPFHLLAYLGTTPQAYAWIAASRLWTAGLGMFLLARAWGLGRWGRWFAGLSYPFCGFLVVWLLFPVTAVAIWMPWLFLATDRVFCRQDARSAGLLAIVVAFVILGGHIQTSAHVLVAAGVYALHRAYVLRAEVASARTPLLTWALGVGLGVGLAAVQILPLGVYLSKSSVWSDRKTERPPWWQIDRPRILDAVSTAVPYVYGSQRRGHPNVARAVGVHNLNESAGGYAGLATLIWLAPLAIATSRREPRVFFLMGLVAFGAMGAFRWPPIDNLLRALPVLGVTDNRRLALWVAFGLTLLGGIGLDQVERSGRLARGWLTAWIVAGAVLASLALTIPFCEARLSERAARHYRRAAFATAGADAGVYLQRADRQVRQFVRFLPAYYSVVAIELGILAALLAYVRRTGLGPAWLRATLIGLTAFDLAVFGYDLNPAISPEIHGLVPPVIERLRVGLPSGSRALGLGEELPPNTLMRFGLCDVRNYDSVELAANLAWLEPLFEHAKSARSSRDLITWERAIIARERLLESGVCAIIGSSPPPAGAFERVEKVGHVWIAWQSGKPWASSLLSRTRLAVIRDHTIARILVQAQEPEELAVRETWDPGWKALIDGKPEKIERKSTAFMNIKIPAGEHEVVLFYDPGEVRLGLFVSCVSLLILILVLTGIRMFWIPGITIAKGLDGPEPSG
jgi:hypothetical protein